MVLEYLTRPLVKKIIFQLKWGDKFDRDLIASLDGLVDNPDIEFQGVRDRLLELNLAYKFRGENESPYLSLSDFGQAVVDRHYDIDFILKKERETQSQQDNEK